MNETNQGNSKLIAEIEQLEEVYDTDSLVSG